MYPNIANLIQLLCLLFYSDKPRRNDTFTFKDCATATEVKYNSKNKECFTFHTERLNVFR